MCAANENISPNLGSSLSKKCIHSYNTPPSSQPYELDSYRDLKLFITVHTFRCTNGDFYVALGSSMSLALLVWIGGGLLKQVLKIFGNEPSLVQKSLILHVPQHFIGVSEELNSVLN